MVAGSMSGLYLFAVVGLLGYLAWKLSALAVRRISNPWLGKGCQVLLTVLLMSLLVADEIVGGYQFRKLCEQNAVLRIDPEKARGRTVRVARALEGSDLLAGYAVPMYRSSISLVDSVTGEDVAATAWNSASSGWFIRTLGISENNTPLFIRPSACYSSMGSQEIARLYGMHLDTN